MRLTAICSVSTFAVGLAVAAGLGQGDMRLPMTLVQAPKPDAVAPKLHVVPPLSLLMPRAPSPRAFSTVMPHSFLIYGLRTAGPGGMACTDRNGAVMPMPFNPQVHMGPFTARPFSTQVLPHTLILPKLTLPNLTPKK